MVLLSVVGCWRSYDTVDAATLRAELDASAFNSGDTWWYAGSDSRYHYFVVRLPPNRESTLDSAVTRASERRFRVSRSQIRLGVEAFDLEADPARWTNLKHPEIEFPEP